MPIPTPGKEESKEDFISRCIASEIDAGVEKDQAAAICYQKWDDKSSKSKDTGKRTIKYK